MTGLMRRICSVLAGLTTLTCGCANAEGEPSAYSYGVVELSVTGDPTADPTTPFRTLWETASRRAAREALEGSSVDTAFRGRTYFGADSDSYMAYAITPERGVFFYLPPGPYPVDGNLMLTLPNTIDACRLEIEWADIDEPAALSDMTLLDFVSKDCEPFGPEVAPEGQVSPDQALAIQDTSTGSGQSASLVSSSMRSGKFDTKKALVAVMAADGRELDRTVPLAGINEDSLVAGIADDGIVFLAMEDIGLSFNQRCILVSGKWSSVNDVSSRIAAKRACRRMAE